MQRGTLFVVSGPSGCGKGTVLEEIRIDPTVHISVSATTREPRPGEVDGVNYYFMTAEKFQEMVQQDGMLESAQYCENFYGTPKKPVEDQLAAGHDVILEIEVVGAMKIRACRPDAVLIFILPPSLSELERRLRGRQTEEEEVVQARIARAVEEMKLADQYDYVLVNDQVPQAVSDLQAVMRTTRIQSMDKTSLVKEVLSK